MIGNPEIDYQIFLEGLLKTCVSKPEPRPRSFETAPADHVIAINVKEQVRSDQVAEA